MTTNDAVIEEAAQALYDSAPNNTRTWAQLPDDMKEIHRRRARIVAGVVEAYYDLVPQ
jgi:hypothetical protein